MGMMVWTGPFRRDATKRLTMVASISADGMVG